MRKVVAPAPIEHPIVTHPASGRRKFMPQETREHEAFCEAAIVGGIPFKTAERQFCARFHASKARFYKIQRRVRDSLKEDDDERKESRRVEAIRRLTMTMHKLFEKIHTPNVSPDMRIVAQYTRLEQLLASLQGTAQPVAVDVNVQVRGAVQAVIMAMSPEQMNDRFQKYRETTALADKARALLGIGTRVPIDTAAE